LSIHPQAEHLVEICRRLHGKNMLASADGNVSYRVSDDEILITPAGVNKARLKPADVAVITLGNAIVHAHPPTAIAWTVARPDLKELPAEALSELILAVGRVPVAPYARPGSLDMGTVLHPYLPECRVILLARHGAIAWGEDIEEAYNGMERLEHVAQILKSAVELGGITTLPAGEVAALREMRRGLGERTL
jgi:L-fuculose-phosphate aldolase